MSDKKRRNWILVAVGLGVLIVVIGIGAILATTVWVQQNLSITETTESAADAEFESVRKMFPGGAPLLELRNGRPVYNAERAASPPSSPPPLDRLNILVWDSDERNLVSFSVPFWFLRLKSGPIGFGSYVSGLDDGRVNLRPEDLEKYGPGIVLDTTFQDGERVLLWVQ